MEQKIKRRSLLGGLGIAATLVAAKVITSPPNKNSDVRPAEEPKGDGYRLTEHIKKYYRTTTI
jgi:hypothetical protein